MRKGSTPPQRRRHIALSLLGFQHGGSDEGKMEGLGIKNKELNVIGLEADLIKLRLGGSSPYTASK